ncbi:transporter substrate-binding domain-containing protein [Vreelandella jeotgali]|uniref:transporter substrate-binding domain-containing protein n=1 Tax=Vreelandella jeotgali TaxID=553386 RepID=UPI00034B953A|nr:transporter substrate-binding domain-containing protein [Halomonas jeotgali]
MTKRLTLSMLTLAVATATAAQAQADDTIRIGVDVPYEPMEFRTAEGELTGFDIELGNAMCAEMNRECEWVVQGWDGIIPGLMARKYDAIMSSMTINDKRRKKVLFSDPYFTPPSAWFIPSSSDLDEPSKESLDGLSVGVQRGTLQDNYATDMYGDIADINRYSTADDMVLDMESERLDIVFLDYPVGQSTLLESDNRDYEVVGDMITEPKKYFGDGFGMAFRQRNEDLAAAFNQALDTLQENGTYDDIKARYFE